MDRAQTYTLEGVFGAALIVLAIIFAMQAVSVSPQSGSLGSQQVAEDRRATAEGILDVAQEEGALKEATLFWNESDENFPYVPPNEDFYAGGRNTHPNEDISPPEIALGEILDEYSGNARVNVNLYYMEGGERELQRMVYQGAPASGAVSASTTVALMDNDEIIHANGSAGAMTVKSVDDSFYAPDAASGAGSSAFYNTVTVEVTLW
ncbi:DUF7288 family protein [Halococcoides cellulosivorans]|uniref:Uncharacterized protein n=1 Tax=Halococcoides cellulosivorans TaxID=1679096 RepID=A0A2R4WXI1_9EURY|nr:hypothetical protein [Halococcoides cellulosivorans]AWB26242.1 hypothetical protein HARCEL1_00155 [Halococcoides cellulosivorans]